MHIVQILFILILIKAIRFCPIDSLKVSKNVESLLKWIVFLLQTLVVEVGGQSSLNVVVHV